MQIRRRVPSIAAIFEAGVHRASSGAEVPFLAMEFVEGSRDLVSFVREQDLDRRARLELFRELCAAVHHGHQKGVIHRDLKPGNVLVDPAGRIKVIDYGVARVAAAEGALETRFGAFGTLPYMSPEQLRGDREGIDVRADVYALGAILYELLAGRPPHDVADRPLAEAIEAITSSAPRPLSSLAPDLPRELDWIAAKALEQDRERRYGTAAELAQDVERHLADEPVLAAPAAASYRARKFFRRHRLALTAAAAVLAAILGGLGGTTAALVRARRAEKLASREKEAALEHAERAAEMRDFLGDSLAAADPGRAGRELLMTDYLGRAAASIDARFAERPDTRGYLHGVVGRAWRGLGQVEQAQRHLTAALELARAAPEPDPVALANAMHDLAVVWTEAGRFEEARGLFDEAEAALVSAGLGESDDRWMIAGSRAWASLAAGQREGVEEALRAALTGLERAGAGASDTIAAQNFLAGLLHEEGRFEEAEALYREILSEADRALGAEAPETMRIQSNLALVQSALGLRAEAIEELVALLETRRRVLGERHPETAMTASNLASLYFYEQRHEEAAPLYASALAALAEELPPDHPAILTLRANLGACGLRLGNHAEAAEHLREVHRLRDASLGEAHERTLGVRFELGNLERVLGRTERALELDEGGLELAREHLGPRHPIAVQFELELGSLYLDLGSLEAGRELVASALADAEAGFGPAPEQTIARARELLDELEARSR